MDDLKSYIIGRLLWNPEADVDAEMRRFFTAVYGEEAGSHMAEYVSLMEKATREHDLHIKQFPNASWLTDELVEQADAIFQKALSVAAEPFRTRILREYLAVRYLRLARQATDTPGRNEEIDRFFDDVKKHGITEIMERNSLAFSRQCMKDSQYSLDRAQRYRLYYIMQ